jgi:copper chaperone CopZ
MKKIILIAGGILLLVTGVVLAKMFGSCENSCPASRASVAEEVSWHGGDDATSSVLRLKVNQVVGSEEKSEELKDALMKVKGVQKVGACTHSGTVSISYDKDQISNVAVLTKAVQKAGYKYEMLQSSCCSTSKGKKSSSSKGCEPTKSCDGKKDKQI